MNAKLDCPHCGQDLRLSPDAKDEIEEAVAQERVACAKVADDHASLEEIIWDKSCTWTECAEAVAQAIRDRGTK